MSYVTSVNPVRAMNRHVADICRKNKILLHPRRLEKDGYTLVYKRNYCIDMPPLKPVLRALPLEQMEAAPTVSSISFLIDRLKELKLAGGYFDVAMFAERALAGIHQMYKEGVLKSGDSFNGNGKTVREVEFDLYDYAAEAWMDAIVHVSTDYSVRSMISRGIISAYRGRAHYGYKSLFNLFAISAKQFRREGCTREAAFDWMRAVEVVTRPAKPLDADEWLKIGRYAQNVVSMVELRAPLIPKRMKREAQRLERLARILSAAEENGAMKSKSSWRINGLDIKDKSFLKLALSVFPG